MKTFLFRTGAPLVIAAALLSIAGCSNPAGTSANSGAARSAEASVSDKVRLVVAEPFIDSAGHPQMSFRVRTNITGNASSSVYINYYNTASKIWQLSPAPLSLIYTGDSLGGQYQTFQGQFPQSVSSLEFQIVGFINASGAAQGVEVIDDNGGQNYKVYNSSVAGLSGLAALGYHAGVVGGNVGLSDARIQSGTTANTLLISFWAEKDLASSTSVGWAGYSLAPYSQFFTQTGSLKTIYSAADGIQLWTVSIPNLPKTGQIRFYPVVNLGQAFADVNFSLEYTGSTEDGTVIR